MNTRDPLTHTELHDAAASDTKLNWLRAAVLGANDGIVSISSVIVGVAGASDSSGFILTAGVAASVAGALSMAVGEYVSVSTQSDTEKALIEKERRELIESPTSELEELVQIYKRKGLSELTARSVAEELTQKDALLAHLDAELNIDPNNLTDPIHAAIASGLAFCSGAIIPLVAMLASPVAWRVPITFVAVIIALGLTGTLSAHAGGANKYRATARVVVGGIVAMLITFGVGKLFGGVAL
jgi:VIT1/CCC1 family predicted Fe2+/Mn2+ transporter